MAFLRHTTKEGERWDTIANRYYNNPFDYVDLIRNNPAYLTQCELPSGVIINVPIKEVTTNQITIKPPWQ